MAGGFVHEEWKLDRKLLPLNGKECGTQPGSCVRGLWFYIEEGGILRFADCARNDGSNFFVNGEENGLPWKAGPPTAR
jgi:hypothetical protein